MKSKKTISAEYKVKKSERNDVVTKGYLEDIGIVTRDYLDYRLEKFGEKLKRDLTRDLTRNLTRSLIMQLGALIENQNIHYDALYQENISRLDRHDRRICKLEKKFS